MNESVVFEGKIVFFSNKLNYGFVQWEKDGVKQPDLFLHFSNLIMKDGGFKTIKKDAKVKFKLGTNFRNQPIAVEVEEVE